MSKIAEIGIKIEGTCKDDIDLINRVRDEADLFRKRLEKLGVTVKYTSWHEHAELLNVQAD